MKLLTRLLEEPGLKEHFEVTREKRKDYRDKIHIDIEMKSLSEKSSATVVVKGDDSYPDKTCLYVKRDDGYNHKQTVRYLIREDETFNVEKAAKKLLELNEWSIEHSESTLFRRASDTHQRALKRQALKEITSLLADTDWEVTDNWESIRITPRGEYAPRMDIKVRSLYAPQITVEFGDVISDEPTNSKKLGLVTELFSSVLSVLESDAFRATLEESPVPA
jgi:hypothetical protein